LWCPSCRSLLAPTPCYTSSPPWILVNQVPLVRALLPCMTMPFCSCCNMPLACRLSSMNHAEPIVCCCCGHHIPSATQLPHACVIMHDPHVCVIMHDPHACVIMHDPHACVLLRFVCNHATWSGHSAVVVYTIKPAPISVQY